MGDAKTGEKARATRLLSVSGKHRRKKIHHSRDENVIGCLVIVVCALHGTVKCCLMSALIIESLVGGFIGLRMRFYKS